MIISTHVLDAVLGRPAAGVPVRLEAPDGSPAGSGVTDADGRVRDLAQGRLEPGDHRLVFDTGTYFDATGRDAFYPEVVVTFRVTDAEHYHVPLLLSPFAYSTYRGS